MAFDADAYLRKRKGGPSVQPSQSTMAGNVSAPIAGANRVIPQLAGLPVDIGTNIANLGIMGYGMGRAGINAIQRAFDPEVERYIPPETLGPQIGGSQWLQENIPKALPGNPFEVQNPQSRLQQNLALGGNIAGYGLASPAQSVTQAAGNVARMTPSAVGAVAGKEIAPENPLAPAIGTTVGALTPAAVSQVAKTGGKVASNVIGSTTGAGSEAVKQAYQAGKTASRTFLNHLRNKAPMDDILTAAKEGVTNMREAASMAYRSGMAKIGNDKAVLDFKPIQEAMEKQAKIGSYKGKVLNKSAQETIQQLRAKIDEWAQLNPAEYHTPEGIDALKRAIGDIRDTTQYRTPSNAAATAVYNSVKNQIVKQSPNYSKVMRGYSESQDAIREIERALSLNEKAAIDTGLRKLQSLMRNNVNTNYGNRLNLAKQLETQGDVSLREGLAGQALSSPIPRGLVGPVSASGGTLAAITHPESWPGLAAAAPFFSPRIMGEAAYGMGLLGRQFPNLPAAGPGLPLSTYGILQDTSQAQ